MWNTRTLLLVLIAFNAIGIGLSEVQRRELVDKPIRVQREFQDSINRLIEEQKAIVTRQTDLMDRMSNQLEDVRIRTNHVEIQLEQLIAGRMSDLTARTNHVEIQLERIATSINDLATRTNQK